jgi:peroxiredoxin
MATNFKIILFTFLVLFLLGCSGLAENTSLSIGQPVPTICLGSGNGETVSTAALKGKSFIITFFTTWSEACQNQLRNLRTLQQKHKNIEIIPVALDNKSSTVIGFFKRNELPFNPLFDKKKEYLDPYQVLIIPTSYLVDKKGNLRKIYVNFDDSIGSMMDNDVSDLLK